MHANASLAVVVTSSAAMLPTRGIWILSTYALRLPTFVIANDAPSSRTTLRAHACVAGDGRKHAWYRCPWTNTSVVVLIPRCGSLEKHGCCRVFRFLQTWSPPQEWVAFVDDDVYVPSCLSKQLPIVATPLFAPSKHVGAQGGWRWSLCGDPGRPTTEIALPAGYGLANRPFVAVLRRDARRMIEQCNATPAYNFDVALSFASWRGEIDLTPALDWTDPRVNWMGGQPRLWRTTSWIYHKVRYRSDFFGLDRRRRAMCGGAHEAAARLFAERRPQTGYAKTRHAHTPSLRGRPFDCQ